MRKIVFILICVVIVFQISLSSCTMCSIVGSGNVTNVDRHLVGFNSIVACCGINVIITQSENEGVIVEADDNIQQYLKTEVNNRVLKIYKNKFLLKTNNIKVLVNVKDIVKIETTSGSNVETTNQIVTDLLKITSTSGSKLKVNVKSKYVTCETTSGANAELKGNADVFDAQSTSGSNLNANEFNIETCKANATSGANINVKVTDEIIANATSGANISVTGNPKSKSINNSSGGSINIE